MIALDECFKVARGGEIRDRSGGSVLSGKSILITGGTGSFGRAFVRSVLAKYPDVRRLVIYSRDELKQFEMSQEFSPAKHKALRYFIGDIRDEDRLRRALEGLELTMMHPVFLRMVKAHGLSIDAFRDELAASASIQHISRIPAHIRRLFVTAHDVSPEHHVRMQAAFQRYSDSGVSKTINLPSSATTADVAEAFLLAYQLGCKGLTVFRNGSREHQVLSCSPAQPC